MLIVQDSIIYRVSTDMFSPFALCVNNKCINVNMHNEFINHTWIYKSLIQ